MGAVDAVKARLAAVESEGSTYAASAYGDAEDAMGQLDSELETQAQSFALLRDYERTNELIGSVGTAVLAMWWEGIGKDPREINEYPPTHPPTHILPNFYP